MTENIFYRFLVPMPMRTHEIHVWMLLSARAYHDVGGGTRSNQKLAPDHERPVAILARNASHPLWGPRTDGRMTFA